MRSTGLHRFNFTTSHCLRITMDVSCADLSVLLYGLEMLSLSVTLTDHCLR